MATAEDVEALPAASPVASFVASPVAQPPSEVPVSSTVPAADAADVIQVTPAEATVQVKTETAAAAEREEVVEDLAPMETTVQVKAEAPAADAEEVTPAPSDQPSESCADAAPTPPPAPANHVLARVHAAPKDEPQGKTAAAAVRKTPKTPLAAHLHADGDLHKLSLLNNVHSKNLDHALLTGRHKHLNDVEVPNSFSFTQNPSAASNEAPIVHRYFVANRSGPVDNGNLYLYLIPRNGYNETIVSLFIT